MARAPIKTDPAIPDPLTPEQTLRARRDVLVSQLGASPPLHAATKRLIQQIAEVDAELRHLLMPPV